MTDTHDHSAFGHDRFGRGAEKAARFFGTPGYIVGQSIAVVVWIGLNSLALVNHWDPYPFILLNLLFSTQASYAAPLILLAQNRQADRDRLQADRDRQVTARTQADAEFLARELASVRLSVGQLATERDIARELGRLTAEVEALRAALENRNYETKP